MEQIILSLIAGVFTQYYYYWDIGTITDLFRKRQWCKWWIGPYWGYYYELLSQGTFPFFQYHIEGIYSKKVWSPVRLSPACLLLPWLTGDIKNVISISRVWRLHRAPHEILASRTHSQVTMWRNKHRKIFLPAGEANTNRVISYTN